MVPRRYSRPAVPFTWLDIESTEFEAMLIRRRTGLGGSDDTCQSETEPSRLGEVEPSNDKKHETNSDEERDLGIRRTA
ncbi:hypothetical protein ACHAPK_011565, partial [Fusarium culmorum]